MLLATCHLFKVYSNQLIRVDIVFHDSLPRATIDTTAKKFQSQMLSSFWIKVHVTIVKKISCEFDTEDVNTLTT